MCPYELSPSKRVQLAALPTFQKYVWVKPHRLNIPFKSYVAQTIE